MQEETQDVLVAPEGMVSAAEGQVEMLDEDDIPAALLVRPVIRYPDERLTTKSQMVGPKDRASLARLIPLMANSMLLHGGLGLAAIQVGVALRVAVIDVTSDPQEPKFLTLINPEIESRSAKNGTYWIGCLSIPGVTLKISRPLSIVVSTELLERPGQRQRFELRGLVAVNVMHQMDLMDGRLLWDRVPEHRKKCAMQDFWRRTNQREQQILKDQKRQKKKGKK